MQWSTDWGYLWTGGGTYVKGAGTGSPTHLVVRMDTQNPGIVEYYAVPHETQVRTACVAFQKALPSAANSVLISCDQSHNC